ncbi:MAG: BREX system Lon protease-like protein BrxL, partial [Candidatus Thorarchaeota archaeon]
MKILISELDELDKKIKDHFPRKIVRKSYAISIPELRRFPNYVSEFLINKYSEDDGTLREDALNEIINIMKKKAPEKKQKEALKSMAIELGAVEIIDHFQVYADLRRGKYYTRVSILDENAVVNRDLISPLKYQSLLKGGLWGKAKFLHIGQGESASLNMNEFESYQAEGVVLSRYINNRKNFSTNEWIDFLIRSNGLNPDKLIHKEKLLYLARLIPLVEACTNSLELGPPGTGKSFVFENASEYCRMLLSGEVSLPNLIYNKNTKQIGLVFKKDVLCFDEINKDNSKLNKLIPKLQQIMASNRVERGELEAMTDVSLVFQGNIDFTLKDGKRVPKEPNYLKILAKDMYDAAFLDRIHIFINGWEIPRINNEHINHKLGLISNYFSELLHKLRKEDCSYLIETNIEFFKLDLENKKRPISIRDKIALIHIISGFIKLIYPNKEISNEEWKQLADLAIILRQNVINEIIKIDPTLYRKIGYEIRHKKDEGAISETIPEKIEEELEDKGVLSTLEEYQTELNLIKINKKNYITDKIPFWLLTSLVDKNNIKIQENFYKLINLNDDLVQVSHLETDPIK